MPDDPGIKGSQDRKRINIHEKHEMTYWTKALGVSADELRNAVKEVGTYAEKVRDFFDKKKKQKVA
jgi:hypothetical protein